ncbi:MAG: hypothetical protein R3B84_00605 [Zavarzinella sp.]
MGLLTSQLGKQRLLSVELPVIERYNAERAADFRIRIQRSEAGMSLHYKLKPCHNTYQLVTTLPADYPSAPPETRVLTELRPCPHLLHNQVLCMWRQSSHRDNHRWDPAKYSCIFAIQAAWRWLACYEIWAVTGDWPFPDAQQ